MTNDIVTIRGEFQRCEISFFTTNMIITLFVDGKEYGLISQEEHGKLIELAYNTFEDFVYEGHPIKNLFLLDVLSIVDPSAVPCRYFLDMLNFDGVQRAEEMGGEFAAPERHFHSENKPCGDCDTCKETEKAEAEEKAIAAHFGWVERD